MSYLVILVCAVFLSAQDSKPELDFTRLSQPAIAGQLGLSDEQRAKVAELLDQRINALAKAKPDEREAIRTGNNQALRAVLTPTQLTRYQEILSGGKLRFNFRGEKWSEVMSWFAREAGLSLVMDQAPPGEFTYSDQKEFTPSQAIDLLNSVLLTKGYTLIRREKMLIVANLGDGLPYELVPEETMEGLSDRGRFEWVRVRFPLQGRPMSAVLDEVKPILSEHGQTTPLAASGQLLVTETAGKMETISVLINAVPVPTTPPPPPKVTPPPKVFVVHSAKGLDIAGTVEMLRNLFNTTAVVGDEKAEEIQVYAPQAQQDLIKSSLDQMIANASGELKDFTDVYPVEPEQIDNIQEQLARLFPGTTFTMDSANSRLVVAANGKTHARIQETLEKLGAAKTGDREVVVTIYRSPKGQGENLAALLREMLPRAQVVVHGDRIAVRGRAAEQTTAKSLIDQVGEDVNRKDSIQLRFYDLNENLTDIVSTIQSLVTEGTVTWLESRGKLSVLADENTQKLVQATIQQINQDLPAAPKKTLRIFSVTPAQKERFNNLFQQLSKELAGASLVSGSRPNEIAVLASEKQHLEVESILKSLARFEDTTRTELLTLPIDVAEPGELVALLKQKLPQHEFLVNASQDALLVWLEPSAMDSVKKIVAATQALLPKSAKPRLAIYPVRSNLDKILPLISPLVTDAKLTPDPENQRLIVWATSSDQERISSLLQELDENEPVQRTLKVYSLGNTDAATARELIAGLETGAKVTATTDAKSLLVQATQSEHSQIEQLIKQLESIKDPSRTRVETYPVDATAADQTLAAAQAVFPQANLSLDASRRKIIAIASGDEHDSIRSLIEKLQPDTPGSPPVLMAYALKKASAEPVAEMLTQLFPDIKILADKRGGRILVTAPLAEQPRFQAMIRQLDAEPAERDQLVLKTYQLPDGPETAFAELIQPMFPDMKFSRDANRGTFVASGTMFDHQKLTRLLEQLKSDAAKPRVLQQYPIHSAPPQEVQNILSQVVPTATFAVNATAGKVVVWADEEQQKLIETAIKQLASVPDDLVLKSYELRQPMTTTIVTMLQSLSKTAKIALSADGKHLVIHASPNDQKLFAAVLEDFDRSGEDDLILRAYTGSANVLQSAADVVSDSFPEARIVAQPDPEKLLIWATPESHQKIEAAISQLKKQLEQPQPDQETRLYPLGNIPRQTAVETLEEEIRSLKLFADTANDRLIIRAPTAVHTKVDSILADLRKTFSGLDEKVIRSHAVRKDVKSQAVTTIASLLPGVEVLTNRNDSAILAKATTADHMALGKLIKTLESEIAAESPRNVVAYRLESVDKPLAIQVLTSRFPDLGLIDDPNESRLLLWATPSQHKSIPAILQDLEQTIATEKKMVVEVHNIDPRKMTAADALDLVNPELKKNTIIQVSSENNSLVVRAAAERQKQLKQELATIVERIAELPTPQTKVYELKNRQGQVFADLVRPLVPDSTLSVTADGARVAVTGRKSSHVLVQSVLEQFDSATADRNLKTVVYRLNSAVPSVIGQAVNSMVPQARVTSDDSSASLIITASDEDQTAIGELLKQINDSALGKRTEVFALDTADPTALSKAITAMLPGASVTPELSTGSVIVTAPDADFPQIEQIVKKLELAAVAQQGNVVPRVYPFDPKLVDAVDMQQVIDPQLREGMSIRINEVGNGLIIRTTPEKHRQLKTIFEQVIAQLPDQKKLATRVYRLKNAAPLSVQKILAQKYSSRDFAVDVNTKTVVATLALADHDELKAIIDQLEKNGRDAPVLTRAFRLHSATASVVAKAVGNLNPNANVTFDLKANSVIVSGTTEELESAETLIKQVDGSTEGKSTRVYRLTQADPRFVSPAIAELIPDARISADRYSKSLFVTATDAEHLQISKLLDELNARQGQVSEVYRLTTADPRYLLPAVQALIPEATVAGDRYSKSLFVTGTEEEHQKVARLIEKLNGEGLNMTTEVYRLDKANSVVVRPALELLVPDGSVAADRLSNTIVVTAPREDQQRVAEVIAKLDKASADELVLRIYRSKFDNPDPINNTIVNMFRDDKDVRITYEWENKRILVVTNEAKHALIKALVEQVDQPKPKQQDRFARIYHLENIDGKAAEGVVRNLYGWWVPRIDVRVEEGTNALIVVATGKQHQDLAPSIKEIDGDLKKLEVFPLVNVDPYTIEQAIDELFAETPENMRPTATSDFDTQQLFVRGSKSQIDLIRDLLVKLGEDVAADSKPVSRGSIRTIPFRGNPIDALREIESVWPRIRKNRIQIIRPNRTQIDRTFPHPDKDSPAVEGTEDKNEPKPPAKPESPQGDGAGIQQASRIRLASYIPQQDSAAKPDRRDSTDQQAPAGKMTKREQEQKPGERKPGSRAQDDRPEIIVIAGDNEVTIASSDLEALDQLEQLLRSIQKRNRGGIGSSNFAVFLLSNSSAKDTAKLLTDLFESIPESERQGSVGNAVFVADDRLNAMVVYGTRKEREVIQEIIEVLDAEDLPDSLTTPVPELIPVTHSSADRVLRILKSVYSNQLNSGGGRKKIDIPEGVTTAVATMLQQINAATTGPILTLGIDEKTNSIVMRAPVELGREIKSFVQRLDDSAASSTSRKIRVLQIQGTNANRVRQILNEMTGGK